MKSYLTKGKWLAFEEANQPIQTQKPAKGTKV